MQTIAIVGSGFSGTLTAVHLLRSGKPLRVVLINRSGLLARGLAYGTRTEAHVLNVPAGRMGAFADDEGDFLRFARHGDGTVAGGDFLPRRLYGEYLEWLLRDAVQRRADSTCYRRRIGHVIDISISSHGATLQLADGEVINADRAVLALGNFAPYDPPLADPRFYQESAHYVRDPWAPDALDAVDLRRPVLLVGAGLTAVDIALDLVERGLREPLYAVSRRGLAPLAHRGLPAYTDGVPLPPALWQGPASARHYLRVLRSHIAALAQQGIDWRDTIGALRAVTPQLWQRLNAAERARFLRHVQVYWEIHRHRLAPELGARFGALIDSGQLLLRAGRIQAMTDADGGVAIALRPRGRSDVQTLQVGSVINCTGPSSQLQRLREPLLAALHARGLLQPDLLGLGLVTADNYALLDRRGEPSSRLFYVGPFLKAKFWEATAVPELRVHAQQLARHLLEGVA